MSEEQKESKKKSSLPSKLGLPEKSVEKKVEVKKKYITTGNLNRNGTSYAKGTEYTGDGISELLEKGLIEKA